MDKHALFANIVPWRPHGDHSAFLANILKKEGWLVSAATCAGGMSACYQKLINRRPFECTWCKYASLKSYPIFDKVFPIDFTKKVNTIEIKNFSPVNSSIGCASRLEIDQHTTRNNLAKDFKTAKYEFESQIAVWQHFLKIERPSIVFIFNGRFHDSAALLQACKLENIRFFTHERTWFGSGIQINEGEDCISLKSIHHLVSKSSEIPLTTEQSIKSLTLIEDRLQGINLGEWRNYGQINSESEWPTPKQGTRILIVPSSRSEFIGHPDYKLDFNSTLDTLDYFLDFHGLPNESIVIRSHPAWTRPIGGFSNSESLKIYKDWAMKRNYHFVDPNSKISTYALMKSADFSIFNGGSSVVEGALLGCPSVVLSPSPYSNAGIALDCSTKEKIEKIDLKFCSHEKLIRQALRYVYARAFRAPYFLKTVVPTGPKACNFIDKEEYNSEEINKLLNSTSYDFESDAIGSPEEEALVIRKYLEGIKFDRPEETPTGQTLKLHKRSKFARLITTINL